MDNKKEHWENVFAVKKENEVSWFQSKPETSLQFVKQFDLPKDAKIIDIGGGDSYFIDSLIDQGFTNLYLLDISANAIERAKARLGDKAKNVTFIVSDSTEFQPKTQFDFWHDRASFHFLTQKIQMEQYVKTAAKAITKNGKMVIGTFSENGPKKCSGLDITQYNETSMNKIFEDDFEKLGCFTQDHKTPFDTIQNFIFCSFSRL